jgi:hypothetical protein
MAWHWHAMAWRGVYRESYERELEMDELREQLASLRQLVALVSQEGLEKQTTVLINLKQVPRVPAGTVSTRQYVEYPLSTANTARTRELGIPASTADRYRTGDCRAAGHVSRAETGC